MIRVFDPSSSYASANQLTNLMQQINTAKKKLEAFKSQIASVWQGPEIAKLNQAVDLRISEMNRISAQLQSASGKIRQTAAMLQKEDMLKLKAEQALAKVSGESESGGGFR
jgi:uncharacterized protein (DUF3084 family)